MRDSDKYWTTFANKNLKGKKIVNCRYLTNSEAADIGWYKRCVVLELDDGTLVYPSGDDEGNDAGSLFGQDSKGKSLTFPVL